MSYPGLICELLSLSISETLLRILFLAYAFFSVFLEITIAYRDTVWLFFRNSILKREFLTRSPFFDSCSKSDFFVIRGGFKGLRALLNR